MIVLLALLILFAGAGAVRAGVGEWRTYTSKYNIRAITSDASGTIWAVSDGGMFSYVANSAGSGKVFSEFTTSEELLTIDLTAIVADAQGRLWIGASNGLIQLYDPHRNEWKYIADLSSSGSPQKGINSFRIIGDTLFIASDIGLSVFSISKMQFGDTYGRFGSGANQIIGGVLSFEILDGNYWVGTRSGPASTPAFNPNPSAPESWQLYDFVPVYRTLPGGGPGARTITGFAQIGNLYYVGTDSALYTYDGNAWDYVSGTEGLSLLSLTLGKYPDCPGASCRVPYLLFVAGNNVWRGPGYPGETGPRVVALGAPALLSTVYFGKAPVVGTQNRGLLLSSSAKPQDSLWTAIAPPGPASNKFVGIAVDEGGVLWSGTGKSNGHGFVSFNGSTWKTYTSETDPRLGGEDYYQVSIGPNNTKWISGWGSGVVLVNSDGVVQKVFKVGNGLLPTLNPSDDPPQKFVVVGGVAADRDGSVWITNRTPPSDTALVLFRPDSALTYVKGLSTRSPARVLADVLIDEYNTKWFTDFSRFEGIPPQPTGLFYYNEANTIRGTSGGWGRLTTADGLTSNEIWSLAVGRDGDLWIGSDQGISIIFYPADPHSVALYHPLRDQVIQDILTDPLNNKWVATKQGVFVLSPDGTSIIQQYTVQNTNGKLLDNDVTSLAIDARKGTIYCGTEKGLSALSTPALAAKSTFDELVLSPNPYRIPSSVDLLVDGLVQGSSLKILTISGSLVREIQTPGGRVGYWDGRNQNGDLVASGIYIVVAYSPDGDQVAKGKLAIIRR